MAHSHPVRNILKSLPQECRDKLARCLNETSPEVLEQLRGIGPHKLGILLDEMEMSIYGLTIEDLRVRPLEQPLEMPQFIATSGGVLFQRNGHIEDITTRVFNRVETLKALLNLFDIPLEYDVNEQLTELRGLRNRLFFFKDQDDPVIRDYLHHIAQNLLHT